MGLSSKMVSNDGLDWKSHNNLLQDQAIMEIQKPFSLKRQLQQNSHHQQQQQQQQQQQKMEQLKCPRCDSTNTKFCYYNNYNKSQPRHFCKACKRHWTKGGTLRNVPVGGGRKNKRTKTSNSTTISGTTATADAAAAAATTTTTNTTTTTGLAFRGDIHLKSASNCTTNQAHRQSQGQNMPLASIGGDDQKGFYEILSQAFMCPPYPISEPPNSIGFNEEAVFNGSITVPLSQDLSLTPQIFPFLGSSTSLIETTYSSIVSSSKTTTTSNSSTSQCSSSNVLCNNNNSARDHHFQAMSDSTITSVVPTTMFNNVHSDHQPATWNLSSSMIDMSGLNWNWDDIDTLVSTNNPNLSWDNNDSEIKP